jgi:hypothetical protein
MKSLPSWLLEIEANLPPRFIDDLVAGQLPVSESVIRSHVAETLEPSLRLQTLACSPDGIRMGISPPKEDLRSCLTYTSTVTMRDLEISPLRREAIFEVSDERLHGVGWLGRVLAPIIHVIVRRIYGGILEAATVRLPEKALMIKPVRARPKHWTLNLSSIPLVRQLGEPRWFGRSVLDVIAITGCQHADRKLLLQGTLPLFRAKQ